MPQLNATIVVVPPQLLDDDLDPALIEHEATVPVVWRDEIDHKIGEASNIRLAGGALIADIELARPTDVEALTFSAHTGDGEAYAELLAVSTRLAD